MTARFSPPTSNVVPPVYTGHDKHRPVPNLSHRLFRHRPASPRGRTVWRLNGVWQDGFDFPWGNNLIVGLRDADLVPAAERPGGEYTDDTHRDRYLFLGGRLYDVSDAVAAELVAAGYTVETTGPTGPTGPFTWATIPGTWADQTATWATV